MNETTTTRGVNFKTKRRGPALDQLCQQNDEKRSPVVGRLLPGENGPVDVASFQSSI
jgi:hypothetical protein